MTLWSARGKVIGFSNLRASVPLICLSHASLHVVLCWGRHQEQETDVGLDWSPGCGVQGVCVWGGGQLAVFCLLVFKI